VETDIRTAERMIAVNVSSLPRLTYAIVSRFAARGAGTM
jgi:short-subunit dehydrogenase